MEQPANSEKYVRTERTEDDYGDLTPHQHILVKPDMYIGSLSRNIREEYVMDLETKKLVVEEVDIPEGMLRLYLEIISNAGDNADASRRMLVDPGTISVTMDKQWITVRSTGEPIPIGVKKTVSTPDRCITIVEHSFSSLLSSSNYDEKVIRMGCGTNGYGAKLTNIYSTEFRVRVGDKKNGREHESVWSNNMYTLKHSKTTPEFQYSKNKDGSYSWNEKKGAKYTGESYVEVSYNVDFKRFGYDEYPDVAFNLFAKYLADFSLTCKIPVSFNGVEFDLRSIKDYTRMIFSESECDTSLIHYEWNGGKPPKELRAIKDFDKFNEAIALCKKSEYIPIVELCILDTPDGSNVFSWANGIVTASGGVHVDEVTTRFAKDALAQFNEIYGKTSVLTEKDIKPHFSIVLNCRVPDPKFIGQCKDKLASPKIKVAFTKDEIGSTSGWEIYDRLKDELTMKSQRMNDKKTSKGKGKFIVKNGCEANLAGSNRSSECILYLTEGTSGSGYTKKRLTMVEGGNDTGGYLPLKGKILNVAKANDEKIGKNKEIDTMEKLLGLKEDVDYTIPENCGSLRYGFCLSCADADVDGKHINSLLINFFNKKYSSYLAAGKFGYLLTPAVKGYNSKGVIEKRFMSENEFNSWIKQNPKTKLKFKYFKGQGGTITSEIQDDLEYAPTVVCLYDSRAKESIELAFDSGREDARKAWILKYRDSTGIDDVIYIDISKLLKKREITNILNTDLIDYSISTLYRALPNNLDGLKKSQRQLLYCYLEQYRYGNSDADTMKVFEMSAACVKSVHYHHSPQSLDKAIVKMTQCYVGANNLPLFIEDGQFGTRAANGKDAAAPRYISTGLMWWTKYAFLEEMINLVPKNLVEGKPAEPEWIPCDIPLDIVNGCAGIATGWSSFIPCHNPEDAIDWCIKKCKGNKTLPKIRPYYRGFKGHIEIKVLNKEDLTDMEYEDAEDVDDDNEAFEEGEVKRGKKAKEEYTGISNIVKGKAMKTYGVYEILEEYADGSYDILITELPIGKYANDYLIWLQSNVNNKPKKGSGKDQITLKRVDKYENFVPSHKEFTHFKVQGIKVIDGELNHETLKLTSAFGLTNMVLIDQRGFPHFYDSVESIMEIYYHNMISMYAKYLEYKIETLKSNLVDIEHVRHFIELVVNDQIIVFKRKRSDIFEQMEAFGIPTKYYGDIKISQCDMDDVEKLTEKLNKMRKELELYMTYTPAGYWMQRLIILKDKIQKHYTDLDKMEIPTKTGKAATKKRATKK